MLISQMTDIINRVPPPLLNALDRLGEKNYRLKELIVSIDYALHRNMSDFVIKKLIKDLLDYIEGRYFVSRHVSQKKIVFFLANQGRRVDLDS